VANAIPVHKAEKPAAQKAPKVDPKVKPEVKTETPMSGKTVRTDS